MIKCPKYGATRRSIFNDHHPGTSALINLHIISLMRKEKEVVDLGTTLRRREISVHKVREVEQNLAKRESEKQNIKAVIETTVRREWEVKARLEIDRQVQSELDRIRKRLESEVQERVAIEVKKYKHNNSNNNTARDDVLRTSTHGSGSPRFSKQGWRSSRSSANMTDDSDTTPSSSVDISQLSLGFPSARKQPKKETRTPSCRSKTFVDSPVDVQMAEPSPISIASLSLSPRRNSGQGGAHDIFTEAERNIAKW
jgi:NIMA (never in mitosis gene a)-related kinase